VFDPNPESVLPDTGSDPTICCRFRDAWDRRCRRPVSQTPAGRYVGLCEVHLAERQRIQAEIDAADRDRPTVAGLLLGCPLRLAVIAIATFLAVVGFMEAGILTPGTELVEVLLVVAVVALGVGRVLSRRAFSWPDPPRRPRGRSVWRRWQR
jgi:hypothetical protein